MDMTLDEIKAHMHTAWTTGEYLSFAELQRLAMDSYGVEINREDLPED